MSSVNKKRFRDVIRKEMLELKTINNVQDNIKSRHKGSIHIPNRLKVVQKTNGIDVNHVLNDKYMIKSAGSHLYLCGLSLFTSGDKQRSRFYNPILILIINSLFVFRSILTFLIPETHSYFHVYLADYAYILKTQNHLTPATMGFVSTAILQQLIHIYNYRHDRRPSYLNVFGK